MVPYLQPSGQVMVDLSQAMVDLSQVISPVTIRHATENKSLNY